MNCKVDNLNCNFFGSFSLRKPFQLEQATLFYSKYCSGNTHRHIFLYTNCLWMLRMGRNLFLFLKYSFKGFQCDFALLLFLKDLPVKLLSYSNASFPAAILVLFCPQRDSFYLFGICCGEFFLFLFWWKRFGYQIMILF